MGLIDKIKSISFNKKKESNNIFKKGINKIKSFYKKNVLKNKNTFNVKEVVFVMLITFLFGMLIGGVVMFGKGTFSSDISDSLNEFVDTYEDILDSYYQEVSAEELLQAGISGMIDYLGDPYASYMSPEAAQSFNEEVEGEYSGIGAEISLNYATNILTIGKVFEDGPAYKAGLKTGDVLLEVEGESIEGLTTEQIASKVKGKTGTTVKLKIRREKEEMDIVITRGHVEISSVETEIIEEKTKRIGYLKISIFASNTYSQFRTKLMELEKEGFDSLLIDVRGNSGGYLTTVTDIISMFTEKDSVIYQLSTKGDIDKIKDKTKEKRDYPVYVLTNSASASASEVLTAALKENYGATILGTTTYGKGKVQKAYNLSNGAKIKYTFQEWLTPNGNSIDEVGIEPDVKIENILNEQNEDNQLKDAIKEIIK